ncbi:MAG TPA: iron-sulfur cluster repair di-iron protein, ric [Halanaerobiaceae bacterium]|nr:iron-sulfur cluster repair di-iron protein, ric [Halanaerobiaceae bacterium]HOA39945.1 iron-sulfur cluster repair di-iron protein, ric [Halanaerobiales bacterium]HPZ62020.1 iron-sulfur cluster repair di-iron protein, ric [Halanaerobiales bacterium]HQD03256.1 iron-sulfur cluster repair di-iron protein, ric [Halanaerobiales bacterium]
MTRKNPFNKIKEEYLPLLDQYVPIVARVHGGSHPEFHEVKKVFDKISDKMKEAGINKADLEREFTSLRDITDNYTVPADVCETYEAVYNMLAELDAAYFS